MSNKNFMDGIKDTLEMVDNVSITENGAIGYRSTGKSLLDLNFSAASLRDKNEDEIIAKWEAAYNENCELALRWLFFLRDVRCGLGERRTFRIIMKHIAKVDPELVSKFIGNKAVSEKYETVGEIIPFYGRWDDIFDLFQDRTVRNKAMRAVTKQFRSDWINYRNCNAYSLLVKWLPSLTASSRKSRIMAKKLAAVIGITETEYRHRLSKMRERVAVTERLMGDRQWGRIDYSSVPSRANLLYAKAFLRHDEERRREFLDAAIKGEERMNSGVVYPHEIVHRIIEGGEDVASLEVMWKNLPNTVKDPNSRTIVVADGSGSMLSKIAKSDANAWDVATALAIYFAEKLQGEFHNKYITFSSNPQYVDLSDCNSLVDKVRYAQRFREVANTNIEAVFDLILETAIRYHMKQEDIPTNILLVSDMEFDECAECNQMQSMGWTPTIPVTLFDEISMRYASHGFKLPRIAFWNVKSRTGTIPMKENELGVCLVSGFSTNLATMVLSGETDPYKCLVDQLMSPRYDPVSTALQ